MGQSKVKSRPLRTLFTWKVVLVFSLFSLVLILIVSTLSSSSMESVLTDSVKGKIRFIQTYCNEKNKLLKQLADQHIVKVVRHQVAFMLKQLQKDTKSDFFLLDSQGIVQIHHQSNRIEKKLNNPRLLKIIKRHRRNDKVKVSYNNDSIIFTAYYQPWSLYIVYITSKENVLNPAYRIRNTILLVSAIFILLAFLLTERFTVKLIHPIEKLSKLSAKLLKGEEKIDWPDSDAKEVQNFVFLLRELLNNLVEKNTSLKDNNQKLALALKKEKEMYDKLEISYEKMAKTQLQLEVANEKLQHTVLAAEEANRIKSEFLAIISHELRTPLTGIQGFSDMLAKDTNLSDENREIAEIIHKSGDRLMNVLCDLLEISRMEAGQLEINYESFDSREIVDDVQILFQNEMKNKNIQFSSNFSGQTIMFSDPARIRQVLLNLVGNAIKFTEGGQISVEVREEANNKILFKVSDTGIGIEPEHQKIIFDMFKQVENIDRRKYGGTGLGLNICQKLVTALNGEIWVESEPKKGSTFFFKLPNLENQLEGNKLFRS